MGDEDKLLPCPFCGGKFTDETCDRIIIYRCKSCNYSRHFEGILQMIKNDCPVMYKKKDGKSGYADDPKYQEYYHHDAHEKAIEKMNKRYTEVKP